MGERIREILKGRVVGTGRRVTPVWKGMQKDLYPRVKLYTILAFVLSVFSGTAGLCKRLGKKNPSKNETLNRSRN